MSLAVLKAVQLARDEAVRQGCMFVDGNHLLLGVLGGDEPNAASRALAVVGLDYGSVRVELDGRVTIPVLNPLQAADVELGPTMRRVMAAASQAAAGRECVATPHVVQALLQEPTCGLLSLLHKADVQEPDQWAAQLADAPSEEQAPPAPVVPTVQDQVARLQGEYRRMLQMGQVPGGREEDAARLSARSRAAQQAQDDDLYE